MTAPHPLTAWQRLRVTATAGLPVKITPDDLRLFANAGEHLEKMIDQNLKLHQDRQAMMDANGDLLRKLMELEGLAADVERAATDTAANTDRLIAHSTKLRAALLLWRAIALCAMAGLIVVVGVAG